jgi:predicted short-subunit dehydrogenase-like oxidoreductase (DUF2520 family)
MLNIVIIGTGNVSHHLCRAIENSKALNLLQLFGRIEKLPQNFNQKIVYTNNLEELKKADFYIICVSDDAILEISNKLIFKNSIIVHTSGSTRLDILSKHKNYGVLYPLQTFSKNKELSFENIPIIIEANSKKVLNEIKKISLQLSKNVIVCNSDQRTLIHISAVFSNNFGNYMNVISENILKSQNIDPQILKPLIQETCDKLKHLTAKKSQTGPAFRNDQITIKKHLNLLKGSKYENIYKSISTEITKLNDEL